MHRTYYNGYQELTLEDEELAHFYSTNELPEQYNNYFLENEYLLLKEKNNDEIIGYYVYKDGKFNPLKYQKIVNTYCEKLLPKNPQQVCAMDILKDASTKLKLIRGVVGSGKDHLMINTALELCEKNIFEKIVFVRPHVPVSGLPDIGSLPGTIDEKLGWTLAPLYDKVGGEEGVRYLMDSHIIELVSMSFIRGRSFNNSIVYMTEGQNMTTDLMKLLISRIGEGSELWINADPAQVDKKMFEHDSGVMRMVEALKGNPLFGYIYLPKTERSEVAALSELL
jgi:PhoH-like ATPase